MAIRYFTLAEANALLPTLSTLMGDLQERRARVAQVRRELAPLLDDQRSNVGNAYASQLVQDFIAIEHLIDEIRGLGCELKDINAGLIDFLSQRGGRDVYLCWRYGEPSIQYFHELHTGFMGRQRL